MKQITSTVVSIIMSLLVVMLLSSCASKPPGQVGLNNWQQQQQINAISNWSVKGRIGVKTLDDGFTSNLNWQHHPDKQNFKIYGSLGQTYAELQQYGDMTKLVLSDDKIYESTDAETLVRDVLGYSLPIEQLQYWILGLPYPDGKNDLTFDELGFLTGIRFQQWHITYKKYKQYDDFGDLYLPSKIIVTNQQVSLRLSLRDWSRKTSL